ncbi:hypothetical protein EJ08DRAFT_625709 [Tothia fuscella]|uniref:Aminoglycoside phosphotransferase domain-containing protein n=1 Tax=Tothia fuscella TaxID=1048955 RepID=A0A9P4U3R4_9PEZI|nr:hypothetical protein EJ08DRAFT_625709 [Tothia fuscella]
MAETEETNANKDLVQHGLKWERDTFSLTPVWTVEPSVQCIEDICNGLLRSYYPEVHGAIEAKVEFLDEGAFNRVYRIDALTKTIRRIKYVFRVSLPVDAQLKTSSEVATIQYLNECTSIPVSTVLDSSQDAKNTLKFEWMLQTFVSGHKLSSIWHNLGYAGRERMIRQLAVIQTQLFQKKFRQIGNIYRRVDPLLSNATQENSVEYKSQQFYVGKIVSIPFILKNAVVDVISRGPFQTATQWLSAQLHNILVECQLLKQSSEKNELEAAERSGEVAQRLLSLLPNLFPDNGTEEETFLFHNDLSQENIFCHEDGTIAAILDWEATPCLPLWVAHDFPRLVQGGDYLEEPDPMEYNRGVDDLLFQDRLLMYQQTKLRGAYVETMGHIWPEWLEEHVRLEKRAQRDFRNAVDLCDSELSWNTILKWVDAMDEYPRTHVYTPLDLF